MQVNFLPQPLPTYLAEEQCDEHTSADEHMLAHNTRESSIRQHPASPLPEERCDEQKQKQAAQQKKVARFKTAAQGGGTPEAPAAVDVLDTAQPRANSKHSKSVTPPPRAAPHPNASPASAHADRADAVRTDLSPQERGELPAGAAVAASVFVLLYYTHQFARQ
jgi:hypothetical protein